jgi:hypothetical protein
MKKHQRSIVFFFILRVQLVCQNSNSQSRMLVSVTVDSVVVSISSEMLDEDTY